MGHFIRCEDFDEGIYKMHFNTKPYFKKKNVDTFYPYVEVMAVFRKLFCASFLLLDLLAVVSIHSMNQDMYWLV